MESHKLNLEFVWIHFIGHGYSISDKDDEYECIMPADYKENGIITEEMIKHVVKYFNKNTKVTCIFDCCRSGSICDVMYNSTGSKGKERTKSILINNCYVMWVHGLKNIIDSE